jgi:hypothetical protein
VKINGKYYSIIIKQKGISDINIKKISETGDYKADFKIIKPIYDSTTSLKYEDSENFYLARYLNTDISYFDNIYNKLKRTIFYSKNIRTNTNNLFFSFFYLSWNETTKELRVSIINDTEFKDNKIDPNPKILFKDNPEKFKNIFVTRKPEEIIGMYHDYAADFQLIFFKAFQELRIKYPNQNIDKIFTFNTTIKSNPIQITFHQDFAPYVDFFSLTYLSDSEETFKGASISKQNEKNEYELLSLVVKNNVTLLINDKILFHATPDSTVNTQIPNKEYKYAIQRDLKPTTLKEFHGRTTKLDDYDEEEEKEIAKNTMQIERNFIRILYYVVDPKIQNYQTTELFYQKIKETKSFDIDFYYKYSGDIGQVIHHHGIMGGQVQTLSNLESHVLKKPILETSPVLKKPILETSLVLKKPILETSLVLKKPVLETSHVLEKPVLETSHVLKTILNDPTMNIIFIKSPEKGGKKISMKRRRKRIHKSIKRKHNTNRKT